MSRSREELKERVGNFTEYAIGFLGLSLCVLAVALLVYAIYEPDPYAPLGPYPEQTVHAEFEVNGFPAFVEGDAIPVTGEKCADGPVDIIGDVQWQSFEPAGTFIPIGTGRRTLDDGCQQLEFANEMPDAVIEANRQIRSQGYDAPVWVITGIETPINQENGERGEPLTWSTEPFAIVDARP